MTKPEMECRTLTIPLEVRSAEAGTIRVSGYAAVFGERANIGDMWVEVIERGAFDDVIGKDDVLFLINHGGLPLARTRSGSLKLSIDERGLKIESELDANDPDVARIVPKMKRGDLDKMSVAFRVGVEEWDDTQQPPLRAIKKMANLFDVSIVGEPAYEGTEIGLRSLEQARLAEERQQNRRAAARRIGERKAEAEHRFRKIH